MLDGARAAVADAPALVPDAQAEVDVFDVHDVVLVEAADHAEELLGHQDAGARDRDAVAIGEHGGIVAVGKAHDVDGHSGLLEADSGVLDASVGIEQTAADRADGWIGVEAGDHRVQPTRLGERVVVQEEHELPGRLGGALVARRPEEAVLLVEDGHDARVVHEERLRGVGRAVVDDDHLGVRRRLTKIHETLQGQLDLVEGRDDDRNARGRRHRPGVIGRAAARLSRAPQAEGAEADQPTVVSLRLRGPLPLVWFGSLREPSGYADEARTFLLALDDAGFEPVAREFVWTKADAGVSGRQLAAVERALARPTPAGDHVWVQHVVPHETHANQPAGRTVVRTMFETDGLPSGFKTRLLAADQIWVPSAFNLETFVAGGIPEHRLRVLPETIDFGLFNARRRAVADRRHARLHVPDELRFHRPEGLRRPARRLGPRLRPG